MIAGVGVEVAREAVVVRAAGDLAVISSAVRGGGLAVARTLVNLHVDPGFVHEAVPDVLGDFIAHRGLPAPVVGLLTAARTERAEIAVEREGALAALAVVTVGLSHPVAAGRSAAAAALAAGTINAIVVVDAAPGPAAMVNLVATLAEVKAAVLVGACVKTAEGWPATGTASDAVLVAATGRGPQCTFGGPVSPLGAAVARAARAAIGAGVRRWLAEFT